jgi:hypothetical protein
VIGEVNRASSFRYTRGSQTVGRPRWGGGVAVGRLGWEASCLYEGHIYFERNMGAR